MDHVANYRPPKDSDDLDDVTKALHAKGCGVKTPPHTSSDSSLEDDDTPVQKQKGEMHFYQSLPWVGGSVWVSGTLSSAYSRDRYPLEKRCNPNVRAVLCGLCHTASIYPYL